MVRAWIADVTPLMEEACYRKYYERVPQFRREKADALRNRKTKAQSIGAWSLWEKIRAEYDLPESSLFNISHSDVYVMCAAHFNLSDEKRRKKQPKDVCQLGCDLERINSLRMNIAKRFFCREQYETILSGKSEKEQTERFYRYWVLKESFMKATRYGMVLGLDSFEIRLEEGREPVLMRQPEKVKEAYFFREFQTPGADARIAVCSTCRQILEPVWRRL